MPHNDFRAQLVAELAQQVRRIERSRSRQRGERARTASAETLLSTGIEPLDHCLPEGGLRRGALVEWLAEGAGSGVATLALLAAVAASKGGGAVAVIDGGREFYPPAAAALGIALDRVLLVRPESPADALWALEQSLRCPGVAASLAWLDRIDGRLFRRLHLAAEAGGGIGVFIRPAGVRRQPSWAEVRLLVQPLPATSSAARRTRIELLHGRGGINGTAIEVEVCDETGDVHLAPPVAAPTTPPRAARAV